MPEGHPIQIMVENHPDLMRRNEVRIVAWMEVPRVLDMPPPSTVRATLVDALQLVEAAARAVAELDAEHRPTWSLAGRLTEKRPDDRPPVGCATCFPNDNYWPCATRLIADELRKRLTPSEPEPVVDIGGLTPWLSPPPGHGVLWGDDGT